MIFIGIGANLAGPDGASPRENCIAALDLLATRGAIQVVALSPWYETEPVPRSDQPMFQNAVAAVESSLDPVALLAEMHAAEHHLGRRRSAANAARIVDLDILLIGDAIRTGPEPPLVPHPRMTERAFVLIPLRDVMNSLEPTLSRRWRLPGAGLSLQQLIDALPPDQGIRPAGP